jgi:hypothetical protein
MFALQRLTSGTWCLPRPDVSVCHQTCCQLLVIPKDGGMHRLPNPGMTAVHTLGIERTAQVTLRVQCDQATTAVNGSNDFFITF